MHTRTILDRIEIAPQTGTVSIRMLKQIADDSGKVLASENHRTSISPDADPATQMEAVNAHLAAMGYPALSDFGHRAHHGGRYKPAMNGDFAEEIAVRTLYGEARGEPEDGRRAVAHVLWNRVRDGRWGRTLTTVCLSRAQFSCWNASDPNREKIASLADDDPVLQTLRTVLRTAGREPDPTSGASHYFSTTMAQPPRWSVDAHFCGQIGRHRFYKDVK